MKRFVTTHTLLSQVLAWFFVAALFCDEANLDDLLSGSVVLHSGGEVYATNPGACDRTNFPMRWEQQRSAGASTVRQSAPLSRTYVRLIIDQDSSSPPAKQIQILFTPLPFLKDSPAISFDSQLPIELLHIRFCTLLI